MQTPLLYSVRNIHTSNCLKRRKYVSCIHVLYSASSVYLLYKQTNRLLRIALRYVQGRSRVCSTYPQLSASRPDRLNSQGIGKQASKQARRVDRSKNHRLTTKERKGCKQASNRKRRHKHGRHDTILNEQNIKSRRVSGWTDSFEKK